MKDGLELIDGPCFEHEVVYSDKSSIAENYRDSKSPTGLIGRAGAAIVGAGAQQSTTTPAGTIPSNYSNTSNAPSPKVVFVFFVGGVTYGEIAALRKLSELEGGARKFVIGTTSFMNFKKFFVSLEDLDIVEGGKVGLTAKNQPREKEKSPDKNAAGGGLMSGGWGIW